MKADESLRDLLAFLNAGVTSLHAVEAARARLQQADFTELRDKDRWKLEAGQAYYVIRDESAIIAWRQGGETATPSLRVVGAHTDSPGLHLKPRAAYANAGFLQLGVEVYGGPLLATWTDRDLGLAGRVVLRTQTGMETRLLKIQKPLLRIPQLAIHLNREVNKEGLLLDKQKHLPPILGIAAGDGPAEERALLELIAGELAVKTDKILGGDLQLFDIQPAVLGGRDEEFVFSGRLDNLTMCHAALQALILQGDETDHTSLITLFDAEEIGSGTVNGAASPFIRDIISRIARFGDKRSDTLERTIARSWCISADGAHATHPNYADYHDPRHPIRLNEGPVIKVNANQRYATTGTTSSMFKLLCEQAEVPFQEYVHRTDLPCGSTIGPITASNLGLRVVDVGNAMLSMHSVRETAGSRDHGQMIRALSFYFTSAADPILTSH